MLSARLHFKEAYLARFDYDSDLLDEITTFCNENTITTAYVSVLGALKNATLGFYNQETRAYESFEINEEVEIVSCYGNISIRDEESFPHLHLIVSAKDGKCYGGHMMPDCTIFAGEAFIYEMKGLPLTREFDETTGLYLWNTDELTSLF